jgi:hypothetical protein
MYTCDTNAVFCETPAIDIEKQYHTPQNSISDHQSYTTDTSAGHNATTVTKTGTLATPNAPPNTLLKPPRGLKRHQPSLLTASSYHKKQAQDPSTIMLAFTIMREAAAQASLASATSAPKKRAKQEPQVDTKGQDLPEGSSIVGISTSNISKIRNQALCIAGQFQINESKWANFVNKIRALDPDASFDKDDPQIVYCSRCKSKVTADDVYKKRRFEQHIQKCPGKLVAKKTLSKIKKLAIPNGTPSILGFFKCNKASHSYEQPSIIKESCPGLTSSDDSRIATYLARTSALGGGARSVRTIAIEKFGAPYSNLSANKKRKVLNK